MSYLKSDREMTFKIVKAIYDYLPHKDDAYEFAEILQENGFKNMVKALNKAQEIRLEFLSKTKSDIDKQIECDASFIAENQESNPTTQTSL